MGSVCSVEDARRELATRRRLDLENNNRRHALRKDRIMSTSPVHRLKVGSLLFLLLLGCKTKSPDEGRDAGDAGDLDANDLDESLDTITPVTDSTDAGPRTVLGDTGTGCAVNAE